MTSGDRAALSSVVGCGGGELRLLVPPERWGEGSGGRRADAGVSPRRAPTWKLASATVDDNGGPGGEEREGKPCADTGAPMLAAGTKEALAASEARLKSADPAAPWASWAPCPAAGAATVPWLRA